MSISHMITQDTITVNFDGKTHMVHRESGEPFYLKVKEAIRTATQTGDWQPVKDLVDRSKAVEKASKGLFEVKNGIVYVDGQTVPNIINDRIVGFMNEDLPFEPLVKFWRNLVQNPSDRAKSDLYSFLEKNNHPITEDGCFIAYKKVRDDYKSIYDSQTDNSIGQTVSMSRSQVNDDPSQTCSFGLHVANYSYAQGFGNGIMVECKVNPKDVVSIPIDYDQSKMRVCEYLVVGDCASERKEQLYNQQSFSQPTVPVDNVDDCSDCGENLDDCDCHCGDCNYHYDDCDCKEEDSCEEIPQEDLELEVVDLEDTTDDQGTDPQELTRKQVQDAINASDTKQGAADALGISRHQLYRLQRKFGMI